MFVSCYIYFLILLGDSYIAYSSVVCPPRPWPCLLSCFSHGHYGMPRYDDHLIPGNVNVNVDMPDPRGGRWREGLETRCISFVAIIDDVSPMQ